MEVSSWENHLFLWAMASMAMLNNQRLYEYCIILRYLSSAKCMFIQCKRSMSRHSDWKGNSFWKLIDPLQLAMTWHHRNLKFTLMFDPEIFYPSWLSVTWVCKNQVIITFPIIQYSNNNPRKHSIFQTDPKYIQIYPNIISSWLYAYQL